MIGSTIDWDSLLIETALDGSTAVFSACRTYRYRLERPLTSTGGPAAVFVMLNPSTADAFADDPTVARCRRFAAAWGMRRLVVLNTFALRSPHPRDLVWTGDPVGPANAAFIECASKIAAGGPIVCAWGTNVAANAQHRAWSAHVIGLLRAQGDLHCLGVTKDGHPRHPLYLPSATPLQRLPG